ncbi:MAG: cytochrome P450 [Deltaproteobacteria bacterium]|nr:cytochrome P450 [Deltaproteobacteria bacterium]MBW2361238.1 cytochrome P450 [Deltaproteobacteria bacterium]
MERTSATSDPQPGLPEPAALNSAAETLGVILEPRGRADLYRYLHRLRELEPMHPTEALHGRPAWVITSHALTYEVLSNHALISDAHNAEIFNTGPGGRRFYELIKSTLLYIGPKEHARLRRLLSRFFSPRRVGGHYAPRIQTVVDGLLDKAGEMGEIDLVKDLAYALPTAVICEILGVPQEDVSSFHHWLNDFARRGDLSGITPEVERKGEEAVIGFTEYFLERIAERRARPREDLMTQLVEIEDEQGRLSDDELVAIFILMIQAGHETTADQIGLGVLGLLHHPDQLALLSREPDRIEAAVEEICRYDSSNQILQRVGTEDFQLGGVTVRAGEVCAMMSGAANRDPAQFTDPDRLDIERHRPHHFGFGAGNHVCMGGPLARTELRSMIGGLVSRFPKLALAEDEPEFRVSLVLRGLKQFKLTLH